MSAPLNLLRNLRHPATPRTTPFDDHEVSVLASLFTRFRDLYTVDKVRLAKAVYSAVVQDWHKDSGNLSYNDEKGYRSLECPEELLQDVVDIFNSFEMLPVQDLTTLDSRYADRVQMELHGSNVRRALEPSGPSQAQEEELLVVKPKISECLFCKQSTLELILRKESCGGKAPGGNSWAYEYSSGACVAMVYKGVCQQCKSVYSLQTYTPGPDIVGSTGPTRHDYSYPENTLYSIAFTCRAYPLHLAKHFRYAEIEFGQVQNILLEEKYQNSEWFQVSKVTIVHFNIIFYYNVQKMNSTYLTVEGYASGLATSWGVADRCTPGAKPAINRIPEKQNVRENVRENKEGNRYILNMKRLNEAIIKGNIVMVLNDHFRKGPQPKYAC
jgi:hypothetical protein